MVISNAQMVTSDMEADKLQLLFLHEAFPPLSIKPRCCSHLHFSHLFFTISKKDSILMILSIKHISCDCNGSTPAPSW